MSEVALDFLCVGPQRTGTTWLYEMLRQHPALYFPQAVKETMFFDRWYDRGLEWYARYFDQQGSNQLCGEVAPTYFDVPVVPERVWEIAPDCEILIGLRHPAERAFSLYLHHLRKGRVSKPFRQAIERRPRIITAGHYATHIPRWKSVFGEGKIHFVFLDDIKSRPQELLEHIYQLIGVDFVEPPSKRDEKVNARSMPNHPWLAKSAALLTTKLHKYELHWIVKIGKKLGLKKLVYEGWQEGIPELAPKDRKFLIQEYKEDIHFIEAETNRDLSHWRQ